MSWSGSEQWWLVERKGRAFILPETRFAYGIRLRGRVHNQAIHPLLLDESADCIMRMVAKATMPVGGIEWQGGGDVGSNKRERQSVSSKLGCVGGRDGSSEEQGLLVVEVELAVIDLNRIVSTFGEE